MRIENEVEHSPFIYTSCLSALSRLRQPLQGQCSKAVNKTSKEDENRVECRITRPPRSVVRDLADRSPLSSMIRKALDPDGDAVASLLKLQ